MCRKLFFLTSFVLVLALAGTNVVFGAVIEKRIASGNDDVEQHLNDGRIDSTSSDLELAYEDAGTPTTDEQVIGLRFVDIQIAPGSTVIRAYVEFEVDKFDKEGSQAPVNLVIEGELTPDAPAFADVANNVTDRIATTSKAKWSIPPWTEQNVKFQTSDISGVIQEIIDQEGWASGNALVLLFRDDKDNPSTGLREAEAFEGESTAAPLLVIETVKPIGIDVRISNGNDDVEQHLNDGRMDITSSDLELPYEDAGTPTTDEQAIGLRFVNLAVPQGTLIISAYVEFEVDKFDKEGSQAPVNLIIEGELAPDAPAFAGVANNVTDRITTTAKAKWSIPPWTEQNVKFQSSDISAVIQEIVNQPGWASGNALVLILRDDKDNPSTGLREAEAFEGESAAAVLLHIEAVIDIASKPDPANGAEGVLIGSTLSWSPIPAGASRDVYFGTSSPPSFIGNQEATTFYPGLVEPGTTYYWRVDEVEADGTTVHTGDVWSFTTGSGNIGADKRITAENDDGEDHIAYGTTADDGAESLGSSDLEMPWEGDVQSSSYQVIGLRFADLAIPKGAPINESYVQLTADNENLDGGPVNLIINGLLQANPSGFGDGENFYTDRVPKTTAEVSWTDIPAWSSGQATLVSRTPDISSIIQEIVNQDGWASGNALILFVRDDETNPSADNRSALAGTALLHIASSSEVATQPNPANKAAGVALDITLSWWPGVHAATHDVYFGTTSPPPFVGNQTAISYDPGPLELNTTYYWQINGVEADGTTTHIGDIWSLKTPRPGTGTILREVWEGIGSGDLVSDLTGNENYPANPSYSDEVTLFEAPTDFADNFGSRLHGWLHPDTSGDYTFWIAADDNCELWLSTDDTPGNAVKIAGHDGWTDSREWSKFPGQQSAPVTLTGSQKYYIMAIYKEGGGGDNLAVAWQGPDSPTQAVISGYYLSPFVNLWAWAPSPADGATDVAKLLTLSWMPGINAISHDVYFGDSSPPPFIGNQTETSYNAGMLDKGKTYYWRVDEVTDTGVLEGAIWSFTVTTAGR